jgi:hypothetical protein
LGAIAPIFKCDETKPPRAMGHHVHHYYCVGDGTEDGEKVFETVLVNVEGEAADEYFVFELFGR